MTKTYMKHYVIMYQIAMKAIIIIVAVDLKKKQMFSQQTFMPCVGLKKGTIFPELVSEYFPGQSMAEIKYIEESNMVKEGCNRWIKTCK